MKLSWLLNRKTSILVSFCLVLCMLSGCSLLGPKSILMGRVDYNEAINRTEDEQMLLSIVRGRYGETFSLLAVNGIAANVSISTRANVDIGFGSENDYLGNLVPFSGGLVYEENPTITYSPVQGERYLRQLLSPIPLDILVLFARGEERSALPIIMLADRINDMQNPEFIDGPEPDGKFLRFAELNRDLRQAGVLQWVADPKREGEFDLMLTGYTSHYSKQVSEFLSLLEITSPVDGAEDIIIPIYFGIKGRGSDGMVVSTRSTYDLIQILRAAVEVPQEHLSARLASSHPAPALAGMKIHINASKNKPANAVAAVKHRGYWFYIDATDADTKRFYLVLRTLWSLSISAGADQRVPPVLTIPVSG